MSARHLALPFALALALSAGGCGFHPLYARADSDPAGQRVFDTIYVDPIDGERVGFEMRDSLMNLLRGADRPEHALYRLRVSVKQTLEGTAVETNASITRYQYNLTATYDLSDIHTGANVTKGTETTVSAYDVVASPYATMVTQQDAQKTGARDIADRIRIDLGVFFTRRSAAK